MQLDLTGKNIVLTGGAGILGRHFAQAFAAAGGRVAVLDIDGEAARARATELPTGQGIGLTCDVSQPESVNKAVDRVVDEWGEIHVLANNAATKSSSLDDFLAPFESYALETWREVMAVNVDGMFLMAQAVAKQMIRQQQGGSIIQTASIYGVLAPDQRIYEGSRYLDRQINTPAVYSASKAAVIGLSQYLSTYLAPHGIRVNTLTPGGMESGQNDEFRRRYSARVPLGRMGHPEELTGAMVYLASDASSYVTGQNLIVDGGLSVW